MSHVPVTTELLGQPSLFLVSHPGAGTFIFLARGTLFGTTFVRNAFRRIDQTGPAATRKTKLRKGEKKSKRDRRI